MDWLEENIKLIIDSFDEDSDQRLQVPKNNVSEKPDESSEDSDCNPRLQFGNVVRHQDVCIHHRSCQKPSVIETIVEMLGFDGGRPEDSDCNARLQSENVVRHRDDCIHRSCQKPSDIETIVEMLGFDGGRPEEDSDCNARISDQPGLDDVHSDIMKDRDLALEHGSTIDPCGRGLHVSEMELGPVHSSVYPSIESNDLFENPSSLSNSISSVELGRDQSNSHPVLDLSEQDRDDGSKEKVVASKTDISSREQLKDLLNSELLKKEGSKLAMTSSELCKELYKLTPTHLVYLDKELGRGNCTVVYEGKCGGLPVAIKRVWLDFIKLIVREVGILILSDQLNNIVQYHGMKKHDNYVDIILELCTCNLTNLIDMVRVRDDVTISSESKPALHAAQNPKWMSILVMLEGIKFWKEENGHVSTDLVNFMRGIVNGIRHLHELKIIHRDIKPENILVRKIDGTICPKIADMGISKRLPEGKSSLTCTSLGTLSWIAPELLQQNQQTMAADMFSMGLVLYYCCSKGEHPFGKEGFIEYNIRNQAPDLSHIEDQLDAHDLIRYLLEKDPTKRPTAEEVLKHPFFWTPEQKLEFLKAASDCIKKARRNKTALFTAIEGCLKLNAPWDTLLDREFVHHMFGFKHARYNRRKVKDLLRIIRNGLAHFNELSQNAQAAIGMSAEAREAYFSSIFPNLLFNVYRVLLYGQFAGDNEMINKYKWR